MRTQEYPYNLAITPVNQGPEDDPGTQAPVACPDAPSLSGHLSAERLRDGRALFELGIGPPLLARMLIRAEENGTLVEEEILACDVIDETTYYRALADRLGLPFLPEIDPERVRDLPLIDTQLSRPQTIRIYHPSRPPVTVIVPTIGRIDAIAATLRRQPSLRHSLGVASPSALRRAVWATGAERRVNDAVNRLFDQAPLHSARITFHGAQGFLTGFLLWGLAVAAYSVPLVSILAAHLLLSLFYLAHLAIRIKAMAVHLPPAPKADLPMAEPLPVYTVLVALYRESAVAHQLVAALDRLDWPRSRLDIKLVCEVDDRETIGAFGAINLGPEYEIVEVPVKLPRTKPKALTYALAGARGSLLTVYDAEDRPHPGQLMSAYRHFLQAGDDVVCLQAPLVVTNAGQSWLSALFALEYSGLFRGLLPMLSSADLPLPLGGTSNHFRTDALRQLGGWDPFNVTEDADLGLRLHRLGFRARVIPQPTLEDAPTEIGVWLAQRTRWFKGWLQTWLVLMREPGRLRREMGIAAFIVFHVLIAGMLLSSLSHPFILAFLVYLVWLLLDDSFGARPMLNAMLLGMDVINIFGSYIVFVVLGLKQMSVRERMAVGWRWLGVPAYWLLVSLAAWRALFELRTRPFEWNKTPHRPAKDSP